MGLLDWNKIGPQGGDYGLLTEKDRRKNAMMAANQGFMAMMEADRRGLPGIQSLGAFGGAMAPAMQAYSEQSKEKRVDERDRAAWKAIAEADPNMPQYMRTALETGDMATFRATAPSYMASQSRTPTETWKVVETSPRGRLLRSSTGNEKFVKTGDSETLKALLGIGTQMARFQKGRDEKYLPAEYMDLHGQMLLQADDQSAQFRKARELWDLGERMDWKTGKREDLIAAMTPWYRAVGGKVDLETLDLAALRQEWMAKRTEQAVQLTKDYKGAISNREIQLFLDAQASPSDEPGAVQGKIIAGMLAAEFSRAKFDDMGMAYFEGIAAVRKAREKWRKLDGATVSELVEAKVISAETARKYELVRGGGAGGASVTSGQRIGVMTDEEIDELAM